MTPIELRARREALGLSQQELAERLGASQNTISQWERGVRSPRNPVSIHLALCGLEDLFADLVEQLHEVAVHASGVRDSPEVELRTYATDADYHAADARARAAAIPAALHRVAAAHVAWEVREDLSIAVAIVA